jgi:Arc/MetJ-type ribon-helix-helix transcriptional regulator
MSRTKVAISLEENTLHRLDELVNQHYFPNRSRAIEEAVEEKLRQLKHRRLAEECAKLDPSYECALAEEGFSKVLDEWPEIKR